MLGANLGSLLYRDDPVMRKSEAKKERQREKEILSANFKSISNVQTSPLNVLIIKFINNTFICSMGNGDLSCTSYVAETLCLQKPHRVKTCSFILSVSAR